MSVDSLAVGVSTSISTVFAGLLIFHFYYLPRWLKEESKEYEAWKLQLEDEIRQSIVRHSNTVSVANDPIALTNDTVDRLIEAATLYSTVDFEADMLLEKHSESRYLPVCDLFVIVITWVATINLALVFSANAFDVLIGLVLIIITGGTIVFIVLKTFAVVRTILDAEALSMTEK